MSEKFYGYVCTHFCVYLGSEFVYIRLTLDLNSALELGLFISLSGFY